MLHRAGPDRHDVTSWRSPGCRQPAWRGTPERQVTPAAHDASPAYSLRRSHTHLASTPYDMVRAAQELRESVLAATLRPRSVLVRSVLVRSVLVRSVLAR